MEVFFGVFLLLLLSIGGMIAILVVGGAVLFFTFGIFSLIIEKANEREVLWVLSYPVAFLWLCISVSLLAVLFSSL